jgi:hypothetical protein
MQRSSADAWNCTSGTWGGAQQHRYSGLSKRVPAFEDGVLVRAVQDGHAVPRETSHRAVFRSRVRGGGEAAASVRQLFATAEGGGHAASGTLSRRDHRQKQSAPGFLPAPPCQIRTGHDSDIRRASRLADLDFDGPAQSRPEATSVLEPHRPNPRGFCTMRHRRTFPAFMALIGPPSALARFKRPRRSRLQLPASKPAFRRAVRASSVRVVVSSCDGAIRGRLRWMYPMRAIRLWEPPMACG